MADHPKGSRQSEDPPSQHFTLAGAGQAFGSRSQDVFGDLETIEAKHEAYERVRRRSRRSDDHSLWKPDPTHEEELSQSSRGNRRPPKRDSDGFVRPDSRPRYHHRRAQKVPDHLQHPERWVKYDLGGVSSDDLSEQANTAAAFAFLSSRRKQNAPSTSTSVSEEMDDDHWTVKPGPSSTMIKKAPSDPEKDSDTFKMKHTFRKPRNASDKNTEESVESEDKPKFLRGRYVMPEYDIGAAPKQRTSNKPVKGQVKAGKSQAALSILDHEDDGDGTDLVTMETEGQPEATKETNMEVTVEKDITQTGFKSRKKFNKKGMRQKRQNESDEED